MNRRKVICNVAASIASAVAGTSFAAGYPERPVQLVVPFPPGGANDLLGRLVAQKMGTLLGGTVVVDNRPGGAAGSVGAQGVATSRPDGYTLLLGNTASLAINSSIYPNLKYDPLRDFEPISMIGSSSLVLVVGKDVAAQDLAGLVKMLKASPGKYAYASAGAGTPLHLAAELFKLQTGTDITHVPYRGTAPVMSDLLTGRITMMFDNTTTAIPHIRNGSLRALAVTGPRRNPLLPNIPTLAEQGIKNAEILVWFGLVAPRGTDPQILSKLSNSASQAVLSDDLRPRLLELDIQPWGSTPEEMKTYVGLELRRWRDVVERAKIKLD